MRACLDCYPCFLRQALEAARFCGADDERQYRVVSRTLDTLKKVDLGKSPPEIARVVHSIVRDELGGEDPYRETKKHSTERALALYPELKLMVRTAQDPLACAVRLAIAGNTIDYGVPGTSVAVDALGELVERLLAQPLAIDHLEHLRQVLGDGGDVLYLADNAGETVFVRVLMEYLDRPLRYVVKGTPALNDATAEDALAAGVGQIAEIVSNGTDAPGTILPELPVALQKEFSHAKVIIAKGQANYETLSECDGNLFFLLKVKCPVIADDLRVPVGGIVVKAGGVNHARI